MNICSPIRKHYAPFSYTGRVHNIDRNKSLVNFTGSNVLCCSAAKKKKAQLHVSATNIGHLQVVQRKLISYTRICRGCIGCRGGGISARSRECGGGGLGFGLVRNHI